MSEEQVEIPWYKKYNPIWWFGNMDEPSPNKKFMPGKPEWLRVLVYSLRNPGHNFTFYTIGFADKKITRTGDYPNDVFSPIGGWNHVEMKVEGSDEVYNFDSYIGFVKDAGTDLPWMVRILFGNKKIKYYFGWRERGNFGIKLTFLKENE